MSQKAQDIYRVVARMISEGDEDDPDGADPEAIIPKIDYILNHEYICKCGLRVMPHRCNTDPGF